MTTHYDNYNFFVIGFSTTERPSDCMVSLGKILLRSGNQNRFIRLENAAALTRPEVKALLSAAAAQAKSPLPCSRPGPYDRQIGVGQAAPPPRAVC